MGGWIRVALPKTRQESLYEPGHSCEANMQRLGRSRICFVSSPSRGYFRVWSSWIDLQTGPETQLAW